jgi:hypothetical protein
MLGGSIGMFFVLPLFILATLFSQRYTSLLWAIIITIAGFIIFNYVFSYLVIHNNSYGLMLSAYIISFPLAVILTGVILTISFFLSFDRTRDIQSSEDIDSIRNFYGFIVASIALPPLTPIIFIPLIHRNIFRSCFIMSMAALIIGFIFFLMKMRKVTIDTLNYYSKPIQRIMIYSKKNESIFIIGILLFFSSYFEMLHRKEWIVWIETALGLVCYVLILNKFGKLIISPTINNNFRPQYLYLPSIVNKQGLISLLLFIIIILLIYSFALIGIIT